MGILSVVSLVGKIVGGAVSVYKLIFGSDKRPPWTVVMAQAAPQIFGLVNQAIEFGGYDSKEKLDDFLSLIDLKTGVDAGALDVFKDVTDKAEEEFFDGLVQMARAYGYAKLKVEGYYQAPEAA